MDLYINTFGTFIHRRDDMFELEVEGVKKTLSPQKIRSIIISNSVRLTSDVIKLALDNNIDVVLMDELGNPYGRFWHARFGSTAFIRRRQLEISETEEGLKYAKEWIITKIQNSIDHLVELEYKRDSKAELIDDYIKEIQQYSEKIKTVDGSLEEKRNTIMAYEGNAGKIYYDILSILIPEPFKFKGRSFMPAKDEFNCTLNYAFGVLYGKVEKAIVIAGLDPFIGLLHTDNYNKKSMVFDFIENFRHLAFSTVFALFSRKLMNKEYFDTIKNGMSLNKEGKQILLEKFSEKLNKSVLYNGRKITNGDIIQFECHNFANSLIGRK